MSLIRDYNRVDDEEKQHFYERLQEIGIEQLDRETLSYISIAISTYVKIDTSDLVYDLCIYNKLNGISGNMDIKANTFIDILIKNNIDDYFSGDRSIIKDDITIYKEIMNDDGAEYAKYENYRLKCELLGVDHTIIVKDGHNYILEKLVPDENGVVTIPDFVNNIPTEAGYNEAENERYLYSKIIWKNPRVMSLGAIFQNNDTKYLDLKEFNISRIPDIRSAFAGCDELEQVDFGSNDFRNTVLCLGLFIECYKIKTIKMNNAKFNRCTAEFNFGNITASPKLKYINLGNMVYRASALKSTFSDCSRGNSIVLSNMCGSETWSDLVIKLGKSSIQSILTFPNSNGNTIVYLDELTGINFMDKTLNIIPDTVQKVMHEFRDTNTDCNIVDENSDFLKIYQDFINKNIALYFCNRVSNLTRKDWGDSYMDASESNITYRGKILDKLYYRNVLPRGIIDTKCFEKYNKTKYKYRLIFSKIKLHFLCNNNDVRLNDNFIVIYFNSCSGWDLQNMMTYVKYSPDDISKFLDKELGF